MKVSIHKALKGRAEGEYLAQARLRIEPASESERLPEEDRDYLVYLRKPNAEQLWVVKVVRPTEETLVDVKRLLNEGPLPGSGLTLREAAERANLIALARVNQLKPGGPADPEGTPYHAKVTMTKTLKGGLSGDHFVYIVVRTAPNGDPERSLVKGREYLFFLNQAPGEETTTIKMLHPTAEGLQRVEGEARNEKR